jgi:hypothetical protein
MFDPKGFTATMEEVARLLKSLGEGAQFNFGTLGLSVAMNGRGVPKAFVDAITDAAKAPSRSSSSAFGRTARSVPPSNHAKLRFQQILNGELSDALKRLRQSYASASGGLSPADWRQAKIEFVIANGGSVGASWQITSFAPNYPGKATMQLPSGPTQIQEIASRLEVHSRLDLSAESKLFELGERGNQLSPYLVAAPTADLALARLIILSAMDLRKFIHVREVIEEQGAVALARMHIGAAKHPEAYA